MQVDEATPSPSDWVANIFTVLGKELRTNFPRGSKLLYGSDCSGIDSPSFGLGAILGELKEAGGWVFAEWRFG